MNYNEMSDAELDVLAAQTFDLKQFLYGANEVVYGYDTWRPCHPDSNQAERYLFPKLLDVYNMKLSHDYHKDSFYILFKKNGCRVLSGQTASEPDQINRTKVVAALEAWHRLEAFSKIGESGG